MKKRILFIAGMLCMMISFHSCDKLSSCKVCQQNTYDDQSGSRINTGSETEYCDAALIRIEATPNVTVLGKTTKWECR